MFVTEKTPARGFGECTEHPLRRRVERLATLVGVEAPSLAELHRLAVGIDFASGNVSNDHGLAVDERHQSEYAIGNPICECGELVETFVELGLHQHLQRWARPPG
jgi:hypothetical protein